MSLLDHFSPLDELIQVIYQGSARFVIISTLDHSRKDPSWRIRLGLAREGRWWQGRWTEDDVLQVTGNKSSPDVLEAFGERLAGAITKGDLRVDGYEPRAANEELKLVIGSTARKPLYMRLNRMGPEDAAQFAADQFLAIALQARSHDCQIYPSTYAPSTSVIPERTTPRKRRTPTKRARAASVSVTESSASEAEAMPAPATPSRHKAALDRTTTQLLSSPAQPPPPARRPKPEPTQAELVARDEIRELKAELARAKSVSASMSNLGSGDGRGGLQGRAAVPAPVQRRGASLANPFKKARRVKAVEFASDGDE